MYHDNFTNKNQHNNLMKRKRTAGELGTHQRVEEQYPLAPAQTGDSHWTPVSPHC